LFVVTRNAQPVGEGDRSNPAHALLWGLGRTLALEHPEIWGSLIDVDDTAPPELIVRYVLAESQAADGEDQVVYHAGLRRVPRLERRSRPTAAAAAPLQGDGSHLVIEATGGMEPSLIRQLSDMGASTIVAVTRDAGSRLGDLTAMLASTGTKLIEVAADAADEAAMTGLFQRFGADLPPLDGIYLAPLTGRPVLLDGTTDDEVNTTFGPELEVVSVLHKLSLKTPVHRFVLFSSITGVIGSTRLARYTATSAFLDAFAYARRALGLPATVVDWGLLKSPVDKEPETTVPGLQLMPAEVAIRALPALLSPDSGVRCAVVAADWGQLTATDRMRGSLRVVADLLVDDNGGETAGAVQADSGADELAAKWDWSQIPAENKLTTLETRLRDILARELGMPASAVDMDQPFPELGLDSRVAMTVLREARELVGFDMSASMLWNHPTISMLAAAIVEMLAPQPVSQHDDVDVTLDSAGSVLDELFDSVESATAGSESGI
jgi:phthiocerol/phenolphthiocerol synthesis type-I polyketide synthase A/phthiocerol/phenolphthiocerol synthesis type-I polyketide synthase B